MRGRTALKLAVEELVGRRVAHRDIMNNAMRLMVDVAFLFYLLVLGPEVGARVRGADPAVDDAPAVFLIVRLEMIPPVAFAMTVVRNNQRGAFWNIIVIVHEIDELRHVDRFEALRFEILHELVMLFSGDLIIKADARIVAFDDRMIHDDHDGGSGSCFSGVPAIFQERADVFFIRMRNVERVQQFGDENFRELRRFLVGVGGRGAAVSVGPGVGVGGS